MRFSAVGASSALLLATAATAFRDSSPLFVWSSTSNDELAAAKEELTSGVVSGDAMFSSLESIGCDWDVVAVVHMDELHQTEIDKITLPYSSSDAALHVPYLIRPSRDALDQSVESWAAKCGARVVDDFERDDGHRTLVYFNVKKGSDVALPSDLGKRHVVVLTGTRDLSRRQEEAPFSSDEATIAAPSAVVDVIAKNGTNTTVPWHNSPILFTTPLLNGLLVGFAIMLPIALFGIVSLAGIQVPPRMLEISKALGVNKDRKDQ